MANNGLVASVPCGRAPSVVLRLVLPGLILLGLLARLMVQGHALAPLSLLVTASTVLLGGCTWWVAQRQATPAAGLFVVALYAGVLSSRTNMLATLSALGLFAMLYAGTGVAHALEGPKRKWAPRIVLVALLSMFTAWAQPIACTAGLILVLGNCRYLVGKTRQPVLLPLFALWTVAGVLGGLHAFNRRPVLVVFAWRQDAALLATLLAAFALWLAWKRSRYYGNTAPLVAAVVLLLLLPVVGPEALLWALAPALIFVAGVFADAFESRQRMGWIAAALILAAMQWLLSVPFVSLG